MSKLRELEKAERDLQETSTQVDSLKYHIQSLESNIALLNGLKIQFTQNLNALKDDGIIAVATEYKKVKEDLETVINRLNVLQIDLNNHISSLGRAEKMLFEIKEKYVTLLNNQDAKVIRGKFGKK